MIKTIVLHMIVPDFIDFNGFYSKRYLNEYHDFVFHSLNGPYVIKPLDGGGSEDTAIIKEAMDLQKWYENSYSRDDEYTA